MKSRTRIGHFDTGIVILAWQNYRPELFHRHHAQRQRISPRRIQQIRQQIRRRGVAPVRQFLPRVRSFNRLSERKVVTSIIVAMIVIFVIVACTVGLVLLGMEGRGKGRAPKLADRMARAAQHLNGDGEPPSRLVKLIESTRGR
jgi:hypothetical protein